MIATMGVIVAIYIILAALSHYDGLLFGSIIPRQLCIFCVFDREQEGFDGQNR